jgi:hypothetical protein
MHTYWGVSIRPVFMDPGFRRDDGGYFLALKSSEALLMQ